MSLSDENDMKVGNSVKKHKRQISSSEDEDTPATSHLQTPDRNTVCKPGSASSNIRQGLRSSERLTQHRQSRSFTMPTRDEIWDVIPSEKSPGKVLRDLKPRRLINNYTKENHRYNYDPAYTSGEESLDNFIDDSPDTSSDEMSQPKHRIKNHRCHRRLVLKTDTSSVTSDTESDNNRSQAISRKKKTSDICNVKTHSENDVREMAKCKHISANNENAEQRLYSDSSNSSGSENFIQSSRKRVVSIEDDTDTDSGLGKKKKLSTRKIGTNTIEQCNSDDTVSSEDEMSFTRLNRSNVIDSEEEPSDTDANLCNEVSNAIYTSVTPSTSQINVDEDQTVANETGNGAECSEESNSEYSDCSEESNSEYSECSVESNSEYSGESGKSFCESSSRTTRERLLQKKREKERLFETFRKVRQQRLAKSATTTE